MSVSPHTLHRTDAAEPEQAARGVQRPLLEPVTEQHARDGGSGLSGTHFRTRNSPSSSSVARVSVDIDKVPRPASKSGKGLDFFLGLIFKRGVG